MTRNLNRLIAAIAAVLLAHVAVGQTASSYRNSIVAEVNDKIITRQMVIDAMKPEVTLLRRQYACLLYTSPSPRDLSTSRMPSSA